MPSPRQLNIELGEALRSGLYNQRTGALKSIDPVTCKVEHCCMGLACEIAAKHGIIPSSVLYNNLGLQQFVGCTALVPAAVCEAFGWVDTDEGYVGKENNPASTARTREPGHFKSFIHLNDIDKLSFKEIAEYLPTEFPNE